MFQNLIIEVIEPIETSRTEILYKVPVYVSDEYNVFVGRGHRRIFNEHTLPNYIKAKLTFAKASSPEKVAEDRDLFEFQMYNCPVKNMEYIGWRASKSFYIVILDEEQLNELKGIKDGS